MPNNAAHDALRHHVSGAIARGEAVPIVAIEAADAEHGETPAENLVARMREVLDELAAERDDEPAEGYDQGFVMGLDEAVDRMREVLDAYDASDAHGAWVREVLDARAATREA